MQGWRNRNEDDHILVLDFDKGFSLFVVCDGHGGSKVAKYFCYRFPILLKENELWQKNEYKKAIRDVFVKLDMELLNEDVRKDLVDNPRYAEKKQVQDNNNEEYATNPAKYAGTTVCGALISKEKLIAFNVGDTCMMIRIGGFQQKVTTEHKPTKKKEKERIEKAGKTVKKGAIDGMIKVSRSVGDHYHKNYKKVSEKDLEELPWIQRAISCQPQVIIAENTDNIEFVIIACDGVWDILNEDAIGGYVAQNYQKQKEEADF